MPWQHANAATASKPKHMDAELECLDKSQAKRLRASDMRSPIRDSPEFNAVKVPACAFQTSHFAAGPEFQGEHPLEPAEGFD